MCIVGAIFHRKFRAFALHDEGLTQGHAIQMIPTGASGDIGTIRSADRVTASKECGRRTRRRDRQEIPTMKTIVLYGLQMLVGLVALAAGYAKLTGMDFMATPFAMIGLGNTFLLIAGTVE